MKIIYYDGGIFTCNTLYFSDGNVIADGYYIIPITLIQRIEAI